ncbi:hypothetical protein U1Q18_002966 [Sarracenia purpurea var. burkii]
MPLICKIHPKDFMDLLKKKTQNDQMVVSDVIIFGLPWTLVLVEDEVAEFWVGSQFLIGSESRHDRFSEIMNYQLKEGEVVERGSFVTQTFQQDQVGIHWFGFLGSVRMQWFSVCNGVDEDECVLYARGCWMK